MFTLAKRLISKQHDVWIMTSRTSDVQYMDYYRKMNLPLRVVHNDDLLETARQLGIADKIIYTDGEDKKDFFFDLGFDLLFDDDAEWHCNLICEAGGMGIQV
jgi:hypothetical protein